MIISAVDIQHRSTLLLIFAGWAMDHRPFGDLVRDDYDLAVAWQYLTDDISSDINLSDYDEICIIAWSFGVIHANRFINAHPQLPITKRIAVNGTLQPVDDLTGIPKIIFDATLSALSESSLQKFYRRVCGSSTAFKQFLLQLPRRDLAELRDELSRIAPLRDSDTDNWDAVYISDADAIIPPDNQRRSWAAHPIVTTIHGPHLPDFKAIVAAEITNKQLVKRQFSRRADTYDSNAEIQALMADRLCEMLPKRDYATAIEIGVGTGLFTAKYLSRIHIDDLRLWDLADSGDIAGHQIEVCDAEAQIRKLPDHSIDLILSNATIQWFNAPQRFIQECRRVLKPCGVLLLSTFGPETFKEITNQSGAFPRYADATAWESTLSKSFGAVTAIAELHTLHFDSPRQLLEHIRLTGVNATNTANDPIQARRAILRLLNSPTSNNPNTSSLTYHPIYLLATSPR